MSAMGGKRTFGTGKISLSYSGLNVLASYPTVELAGPSLAAASFPLSPPAPTG